MKYSNITKATFISRPNRFVANVKLNNETIAVHVKNTGRCKELLTPGATVYLVKSDNTERKYIYDLVSVEKIRENKSSLMINMDSYAPNIACGEWLRSGANGLFSKDVKVKAETTYGDSRFDFYIEDGNRKAFMEVKGVTLEFDGYAKFPDAPTERGAKHLYELVKAYENGYEAYALFVIQMKAITKFSPFDERDKAFGEALRYASNKGVKILAMDCICTPDSMNIDKSVEIIL